MALKKIVHLNEGPMDYIRGAANRVAPAIRQVHQAGQQTSLSANFQKALAQLVQMIQRIPPAQSPAAKPTNNNPRPTQQAAAGAPTTNANMPRGNPGLFASYLHDTMDDQLNEGPMDFLKGAVGAIGQKIGDKVNDYATSGKSVLRDIVAAGNARSEEGAAARQNQQLQKQVMLVKQLMQKLKLNRNQALRAIATAVKPAGVDGNYVAKLLGLASAAPVQQSTPAPQAAPNQAPVRTSHSYTQQGRSINPVGRKSY